jgi:putative DNA methylase
MKKKLIEVALPLDAINKASAREKSIRHGHPSTLHLWWARRPLAAARAVIFAQMVDDPSAHPDLFPTEAKQQKERERLFKIIEDLVLWENTTKETVLERARTEIRRSWARECLGTAGSQLSDAEIKTMLDAGKMPALPGFHDPFAGGGALPLEAQRLGLEAYASDLNPVAVLINKAMIEIPPRFAGRPPVNPEARKDKSLFAREWKGAQGLAEDVRYYGQWMRDEAEKRIGHLYPKIEVTAEMAKERPDLKPYVGEKLTVIAWLWARTVKSPNPAFAHVDVPLASTFMLSTKPGKEAYVEPVIEDGGYRFTVKVGKPKDAEGAKNGTKSGGSHSNFLCLMSGTPMPFDFLRAESRAGRMGARLMAVVAEGQRGRVYLTPTLEHEAAARKAKPEWKPDVEICHWPGRTNVVEYGLTTFGDLFTPRQLVALTTFSDLVGEAMQQARHDALGARASRPRTTFHRTHLPHFEAGETPQHITFRLGDSLPAEIRATWEEELRALSDDDARDVERRKRIASALDQGHGECHLRDPRIASLVEEALQHFDGSRYRLHAWVVMPNHVHALVTPLYENSLSSIVQGWKSFTAKQANAILSRAGTFWQADYFDRYIRDENHWNRVLAYIHENPVKAGLCERAEAWRWSSAWDGEEDSGAGRGEESRAGRPPSQDDMRLAEGGTGATAYAEAVRVYLAFALSKQADLGNSLCRWEPIAQCPRQLFGRQAIPMIWDYAEGNPLGDSSGAWTVFVDGIVRAFTKAFEDVRSNASGHAQQADAGIQSISTDKLVSTDPPYYDNIGYADLSDFFYVWLRHSLRPVFPDLFATLAVPKAEELVATPYRHGSKEKAESFFLDGMTQAMRRLAEQAHPAFPVTIYYAFKQAETLGARASGPHAGGTPAVPGTASTGWETFLDAVIRAGFGVSGTWPIRTERTQGLKGASNALASSIVLVCRQRAADAPTATRREFVGALKAELPTALRHLQQGNIAPVDLAQAAIGPGMAVYTRYAKVLDAEGKPVPVREALALINQVLDETLAEQEGDFDADSRFAIAWFEQHGFAEGEFGVADVLARAKNTSVEGLRDAGILESKRGKVRLLEAADLPEDWDPATDPRFTHWEAVHHLIRALQAGGERAAAALVARLGSRAETARELAYRLYTLSERKKRAAEALQYNALVQSWPEIARLAREGGEAAAGDQGGLFTDETT